MLKTIHCTGIAVERVTYLPVANRGVVFSQNVSSAVKPFETITFSREIFATVYGELHTQICRALRIE